MTRTPDEIKKGLECCMGDPLVWHCDECHYAEDGAEVDDGCDHNGAQVMQDTLALIQQLEAQVPRWISVEERLPEADTVVIVCGHGKVTTGIYYKVMQGEMVMWMTRDAVDITNWMPLPLPPSSPDGESTSLEDGGSGTN